MAGTWLQFVLKNRMPEEYVIVCWCISFTLDLQLQVQLHKYREEPLQPTDVTHGYKFDPPVSTLSPQTIFTPKANQHIIDDDIIQVTDIYDSLIKSDTPVADVQI